MSFSDENGEKGERRERMTRGKEWRTKDRKTLTNRQQP